MGRLQEYMQKRGLSCRLSAKVTELMATLDNGGVAIVGTFKEKNFQGHAKLISGAESRDGQVFLRMNDPQRNTVTREPMSPLIDQLNGLSNFVNMYLIEKPVHVR
jgi:Papain-like cysteine protease AvrRpt2